MRSRLWSTVAGVVRHNNAVPLHFTRTAPTIQRLEPSLPPVIMVHGVLASESTYRSIMKRPDFAPKREKIGIDLRNHGKSPHLHPTDSMTYEDMAADVASFMNDEGIGKACIIGHSMGGKVAMHFALSQPERVSELVVVDIAPINYTIGKDSGDPQTATSAMRSIDLRGVQSRDEVDDLLKKAGIEKEAVRQFVMTNLVPTSDEQSDAKYRWKVNLEAVEASFSDIMAFPDHTGTKFDGPTCLIRGGKSKYVPFQSMRVFTSLFPNTKLVTLSEAGHWLQAQMPDEFCKSVNDFLKD